VLVQWPVVSRCACQSRGSLPPSSHFPAYTSSLEKRDGGAGGRIASSGLGEGQAGAQGWRRRSHLLWVGSGVSSLNREPDARAALTLGWRRTRAPLKRRGLVNRGETLPAVGPRFLPPWVQGTLPKVYGGAWRLKLKQTNKCRERLPLSGVNSGL
jgi:hypothetical protein